MTEEQKYSILSERVFSTNYGDRSLTEILYLLRRGEDLLFTRLPGHREIAFYKFLVRLACLCGGLCWTSEIEWRNALLNLTKRDETPWFLYVKDSFKPAFMQPPALFEEKRVKRIWHPDKEGSLFLSRSHDNKPDTVRSYTPEDWIFTLIDVQTSSKYKGTGSYGSARVSQIGTDILVSFSPSLSWGDRFNADLLKLPSSFEISGGHGHRLLWTLPWDGNKNQMLDVASLHPMCIEVSRLVRILPDLTMIKQGTQGPRVDFKYGMELYDPWAPNIAGTSTEYKRVDIPKRGLDYRFVNHILQTPEKDRLPCLQPSRYDKVMIIEGISRDPKKLVTYGLHRLVVPRMTEEELTEAIQRERDTEKTLGALLNHLGYPVFDYGAWSFRLVSGARDTFKADFYRDLDQDRDLWLQRVRQAIVDQACNAIVRGWKGTHQQDPNGLRPNYFIQLKRLLQTLLMSDKYPDPSWVEIPRSAHRVEHAALARIQEYLLTKLPSRLRALPEAAICRLVWETPGMGGLPDKTIQALSFLAWCFAQRPPNLQPKPWGEALRGTRFAKLACDPSKGSNWQRLQNAGRHLTRNQVPFCLHDVLDLMLSEDHSTQEAIRLKVAYDYA